MRDLQKIILSATAGGLLAAGIVVGIRSAKSAALAIPVSGPSPDLVSAQPAEVPWDRLHRTEMVKMKSDADELAMAGRWQESYNRYLAILTMAGDHELSDPITIAAVTGAQESQNRLMPFLNAVVSPMSVPVAVARVVTASSPVIATPNPEVFQPVISKDAATVAPSVEASPPRGMFGNTAPPRQSPAAATISQPGAENHSALSPVSNLTDTTNLTDSTPQTSTVYDRGPGEPLPEIIFKRVPQPVAGGTPGMSGTGTETVTVSVGPRPAGSPPVTGTVDGHSYSIGGPGEPSSVSFPGLPISTLAVSVNGQSYSLSPGQTLNFSLPNSSPSPPSGQTKGHLPLTNSPTTPAKPTIVPVPPGKHPGTSSK